MTPAKILGIFLAATALAAPLAVSAQQTESTPSYSRPSPTVSGEDVIKGRVISFDGAYSLQVADERGFTDNVRLRQGTIINPTGITLARGMSVTIHGSNNGSSLIANEIDTPYNSYGAVPAYPYYPYGGYPYPAYGYGYDPRVSIGIGFGGFGGGFHGRGRFR